MKNKLNQINQFNGGMVKDIEPLMVPNTVMTDCLNGTLITYNGNEFALQNDMGNYSFKNGGLSNGFVPVGMKEHQGVLYIISYNPIEDKVEIGSFPSQQTIFTPTIGNTKSTLKDITLDKTDFYDNLEKDTNITIFSKEPEYYLNPGDKYLLVMKNDEEEKESSFKEMINYINETAYWRHLVPYILTDENKLYNVDGFIELQADKSTFNRSDWIPVSWDIPGWLAMKFSITVPEQFNIYFDKSKTYVDETDLNNIKVYPSGDLRVQTYWDLTNYTSKDLSNIKDNLVYFLHDDILDEENIKTLTPISLEPNNLISYNKFQSIIFNTISAEELGDSKYITPALLVKNENEENYIIYSQFTQAISRNPITINTKKIKFGESYFKYFVGDSSLTILASWESFPGVNLEYQLKRYSTTDSTNLHIAVDWTQVSDLVSNGTIIIDIPFSENNNDSYTINTSEGKKETRVNFNKEDIYFLELQYVINVESEEPKKSITGNISFKDNEIYATELINRWYYVKDDFTKIKPKDIVDYFADYVKLELNTDNYKFTETPFLLRKGNEDKVDIEINDYEFNVDPSSKSYLDSLQLVYPKNLPDTYDTSHIGIKTIFKQGTKYSIVKSGENLVYTKVTPKDQNGDEGRLWKGLHEEVNSGKAVDSKGNTYTLTFDKDKESFSFNLFNTFTITNSEYNIIKEVSTRDKFLYEYHPIGETETKVDSKDQSIIYRPEYVEFRKDRSARDAWSMCFWKKNVKPIKIKFEDNELTYNGEIISPESNTWPAAFGALAEGSWSRTGWKPDGNSATSTKSYADDYGFNIYNFYNAKFGKGSAHSGDSGVLGTYGGGTNFGLAMSYETKDSWPCIYYCSNKKPDNIDNDYISKTCIYSYLMIIYCLRYCLNSSVKVKYYSLYNYRESLIGSVYLKTINISGTYDWEYFMENGYSVPNGIENLFNSSLFTELNNIISTNTNVNLNCIITPDETFKEYLQNLVDTKNSEVRLAVDTLENQPNIKIGDLYLIPEYVESKNKVKLTDAVKTMIFTDQIRSTIGSTSELFMRWSDKNTRSVAREFTSNLYQVNE